MESKPDTIVEDVGGEKDTKKEGVDGMEFDLEDELLKIKQSDIDHDQELLQIQRRKSTPKVVVEEFVQVDSEDEDIIDSKPKLEESKEGEKQEETGQVTIPR